MKLPDFTNDEALNELRAEMGEVELRLFVPEIQFVDTLTVEEVETLAREGIDIPLDGVQVLPDGTLAYKGHRVILYIRDVKQYREAELTLPRFHLADCETLQNMREKNRFERYVVATRETGIFQIKRMTPNSRRYVASDEKLRVCQFCLSKLDWNGFTSHRHITPRREQTVSTFSLADYFERFGRSLIDQIPLHTEATAPENHYTKDFPEIAERLKRKAGFKCSKCGVDLSIYRRFLHAHHRNGLQYDNLENNIELLCIEHHAAVHSHMLGMRELEEYLALRRAGKIGSR